jgi:hypothetical protein
MIIMMIIIIINNDNNNNYNGGCGNYITGRIFIKTSLSFI